MKKNEKRQQRFQSRAVIAPLNQQPDGDGQAMESTTGER